MSESLNKSENEKLLSEIQVLVQDISDLKESIENKKLKHSQKKEDMERYREQLFSDIDAYYSLLIRKLEEKRDKVKEDYRDIEQREK